MDDQIKHPEPIDYAAAGEQLLAALRQRQRNRLPGRPPRVISALAIARRFGIREHGSRDSRKRGVRLLVDHLRNLGHDVIAQTGRDGGYYLPSGPADLASYADQRRRGGLAALAAAARVTRSPLASDASGQLLLTLEHPFTPTPTPLTPPSNPAPSSLPAPSFSGPGASASGGTPS